MHCLWINKSVSNLPPCDFSLWTTHQNLDIGWVSKNSYQTFKNYHKCDKCDNSQIHTVTIKEHQGEERNQNAIQKKNGINCQWNRQQKRPTRHAIINVITNQDHHQSHQDITLTHHLHTSPTPRNFYYCPFEQLTFYVPYLYVFHFIFVCNYSNHIKGIVWEINKQYQIESPLVLFFKLDYSLGHLSKLKYL